MAWLDRLEAEHDNLRTALAWSLERGASEGALRLAGALYYFWELRGYWSEGQKWLEEALALAEREQSEGGATGAYAADRAALSRRAKALYATGRMRFGALLDIGGSRTMVEESLRLWRELGDTWWTAVALEHVGFMLIMEDIQTAIARLEEGVALAREVEDRWPLAMCLLRLAAALVNTDMAAARRMGEEWVAVARSVGDKSVLSLGLAGMAPFYWLEGNLTAAASLAEEALGEARAIGSVYQVFIALLILVGTSCLQGDLAKARRYCVEALDYTRATGASVWLLLQLLVCSVVACFGGEAERGVRLFAAGETILRQSGVDFSTIAGRAGPGFMVFPQALEKAQAQLGPAAFQATWAQGQQMTMEQALALATEDEGTDASAPEA